MSNELEPRRNDITASYSEPANLWPAARQAKNLYGPSLVDLAKTFAPQYQAVVARDPDRCMTDPQVPTLAVAANAYGHSGIIGWLVGQMESLNRMTGVRDKAQTDELQSVAEAVLAAYPHLRMTDIMLFMSRFKAGVYGRFYGTVDALVVTDGLAKYCADRSKSIIRIEAAKNTVARKIARLANLGEASFNVDELRQSPLWEVFNDRQRQWLGAVAAQFEYSCQSFQRFEFLFEAKKNSRGQFEVSLNQRQNEAVKNALKRK